MKLFITIFSFVGIGCLLTFLFTGNIWLLIPACLGYGLSLGIVSGWAMDD